ncbi:MAG TPA: hypothetical protein VFU22_33500 [Roseiflexaceae bacterium]|nr:hypothetical protein [Roseiflexaceae bacterium]
MTVSSHDRAPAMAQPEQRAARQTATGVAARWERRLQQIALVLARLGLAYLFFTQLWWKTPPTFGCGADFAFTSAAADGKLQRTRGLCDWIGIESVYATQPRPLLVANIDNRGAPEIALDIGWVARLNGAFIDSVVKPNIRWFGYAIFVAEAFIFASLALGLFSRLGGLVAIGMSAQLLIGLAGIPNPYEWEWAYINMVLLAIVIFAFAPGRYLGLDALLRPRLVTAAANGSRIARVVLALT